MIQGVFKRVLKIFVVAAKPSQGTALRNVKKLIQDGGKSD